MKSNRPHVPLFATINVTGVCNLHCRYCFFQPRLEKHMPTKDYFRIVDEMSETNVFFVNISGGEPFTHPDICSMLKYAHDAFQHVVVLSNGTILKRRHFETIDHIVKQKGGFPIQISLDSIDSEINRQTRSESKIILKNLETLNHIGANIVVAMVVSQFNAPTILETIRHLSASVHHFHIMTVQKVRSLPDDEQLPLSKPEQHKLWEELAALKQELGVYIEMPDNDVDNDIGCAFGAPCMAGFSHIVVDPDLKVRPCDRCVETFVGDLSWQSLSEVWNGEHLLTVVQSPVVFCQRDDQKLVGPTPV